MTWWDVGVILAAVFLIGATVWRYFKEEGPL